MKQGIAGIHYPAVREGFCLQDEAGCDEDAGFQDERKEHFSRVFGSLTDEEKEQLLALLEKLTAEK